MADLKLADTKSFQASLSDVQSDRIPHDVTARQQGCMVAVPNQWQGMAPLPLGAVNHLTDELRSAFFRTVMIKTYSISCHHVIKIRYLFDFFTSLEAERNIKLQP